jgi:YVTN family beta-propeller protein
MSTEPLFGVGSTIGHYRVDAVLGRGGMGVVYRAEDLRLGRKVALKLLRPSVAGDGRFRERFLRESRLAASIEHAAIVPIYEAGETDGLLYITMRFVDGVDLAELLRREGPLAPERAVALVGQLASALDAAHARGLIHRDVKPSNALIATNGDGEHAYLVDFGITQDTTAQERLTATGQLVGTLGYLAPERLRGEPVDGRADTYALGCVLFECLTGQVPFARNNEAAAIYAHLEEQPPRPSELRPELPKALDGVVARALAKDRADRWQTGAELRAAAQRALATTAPARARLPLRGRLAAAAALAALAIAASGALLLGNDDVPGLAAIDANTVGLIDAGSGRITAQYSVGRDPGAIAAGAGSVWVANRRDGTVSRINPTRREIATISVGGEPTALAFGAGSLWVADGQGRIVSQIDPQLNKVVHPYEVGNAAAAVAVGSGAVWVASAVDATVARIDLTSGRVSKPIEVGGRPSAVAAGAGAIWVASEETASVIRLDPRSGTPLARIQVGNGPSGVAVGAGAVWAANREDGTVSRIDPGTDKQNDLVPVGREPRAIAVDRDGVWVANAGDGTVMRIDPRSRQVTETIDVESRPAALAVVDGTVWTAALATTSTHRGGTLRVSFSKIGAGKVSDPARWGAFTPPTSLVYDGLVAYRRAGGSAGTALAADLAIDLPVPSPDGRTYRFRLRPDLRFSDGAPVTPEDVRASLARLLAFGDPGFYDELDAIPGAAACADRRVPARARFQRCDLSDGVETDAATRTITFQLTTPDADFLHKLHALSVVPADSPGRVVNTPALPGTGPYMIRRWDPRKGGLLVRNPRFRAWTPDRPDGFPDQIAMQYLKPKAQIDAIDDGESDIAVFDGPTKFAARLRTQHGARLHADPAPGTAYAFLNVHAPPFDDVRVRRALNYAVDRGRIAENEGTRETHKPTCQLLPPGFQGYTPSCPFTVDPNPAGSWTGPDLAKARRLVAASGTRGMKVEFWDAHPYERFGRYFRKILRAIGYRASVRTFSDLGLIAENAAGEPRPRPQIGLWFWYANSLATFTYLQALVSCSGGINLSRFCAPEIDARMADAARTRGPEAIELWRRVETGLEAEAPTVPILNWYLISLTAERVGNFQAHPLRGPLLEQLWVK